MTALKLIGFTGEVPRIQPRQLPDAGAQYALDCRLENGALVPVNERRLVVGLSSLGLPEINTIYLHGSDWLGWQAAVDVVPGPVATDRLYYTGDGVPKMRVGSTVYDLALTAPAAALSGSLSGVGTGNVVTLLYVYTRVTDYGEESEPSPISAGIPWQSGNTVTLSGFVAAPAGRAYTKQRIYRSQTSASGAGLYLINERADTASNYADVVDLSAINDLLPSKDYNPPPADLHGLIGIPGGIMVGLSGKKVCFSEPYRPHAWPEKYQLTTNYTGVALGAFGRSIVVATEGTPEIITGTLPENMLPEKLESNLPCVNPRSMVDLGYAVAYASHDGLVVVSSGSARVVTDSLLTREQWAKENPSAMVASQFNGRYFTSYEYLDDDGNTLKGSYAIDLTGAQPFLIRYNVSADATFFDVKSGILYILIGDTVYEFDSIGTTPGPLRWKSKLFVLPRPDNFGAIYVDGGRNLTSDEQAALDAEHQQFLHDNEVLYYGTGYIPYVPKYSSFNGPKYNELQINGNSLETWGDATPTTPGGSMLSEINGAPINGYALGGDGLQRVDDSISEVFIYVYADGKLVKTVTELNKVVRLPGGFKAVKWEVEVYGNQPIFEIAMASSAGELRSL